MLLSSGASTNLQELDSIGRMPEITVTAPRYEYQDEAWLGMVEGVVIKVHRPASDRSRSATNDESNEMVSGNMSSTDVKSTSRHLGDPAYLLILVTVTLVMLSIIYISLRAYHTTEEIKHERAKH
jgi:hypothetical protein